MILPYVDFFLISISFGERGSLSGLSTIGQIAVTLTEVTLRC